MSPNLAVAHWQRGATLIFSGQPMRGLDALEICIRLGPRDPFMAVRLLHIACRLYFAREYEGVIEAAKRLILSYPDFPMIYRWPWLTQGRMGGLTRLEYRELRIQLYLGRLGTAVFPAQPTYCPDHVTQW